MGTAYKCTSQWRRDGFGDRLGPEFYSFTEKKQKFVAFSIVPVTPNFFYDLIFSTFRTKYDEEYTVRLSIGQQRVIIKFLSFTEQVIENIIANVLYSLDLSKSYNSFSGIFWDWFINSRIHRWYLYVTFHKMIIFFV